MGGPTQRCFLLPSGRFRPFQTNQGEVAIGGGCGNWNSEELAAQLQSPASLTKIRQRSFLMIAAMRPIEPVINAPVKGSTIAKVFHKRKSNDSRTTHRKGPRLRDCGRCNSSRRCRGEQHQRSRYEGGFCGLDCRRRYHRHLHGGACNSQLDSGWTHLHDRNES